MGFVAPGHANRINLRTVYLVEDASMKTASLLYTTLRRPAPPGSQRAPTRGRVGTQHIWKNDFLPQQGLTKEVPKPAGTLPSRLSSR